MFFLFYFTEADSAVGCPAYTDLKGESAGEITGGDVPA